MEDPDGTIAFGRKRPGSQTGSQSGGYEANLGGTRLREARSRDVAGAGVGRIASGWRARIHGGSVRATAQGTLRASRAHFSGGKTEFHLGGRRRGLPPNLEHGTLHRRG